MNIFPSIIDKGEFNSNAEYKVYQHAVESNIFEKNKHCFFFHSVKNPTPGDYKLMGETDFIYLDREIVLFIEVKGGQVKFDSTSNKWWVMGGTKEKDPFSQAANNLFDYRDKKLPGLFNGKQEVRRLMFGYCVFFPDCNKPVSFNKYKKGNLEYDPELIIDYNDFENKSFSNIIHQLKAYWKNHESYKRINPTGLSRQELFKIKSFIRRDIVFEMPWTNLLKKNDAYFKRYTDDAQMQTLLLLEDNSHMGAIVKGGPGTGKTWLALEQAKRLDLKNKKVLFLCFNKNLSYFLQRQLGQLETTNVSAIHVDLFYSQVLKETFNVSIAKLKEEWTQKYPTGGYENEQQFWQQEVPLSVYSYFNDYDVDKYDFVIMDESQDYFSEYRIDAINCFLDGGFESGKFLICIDNENQDIYLNNTKDFEEYFKSIYPNYITRLTRNCRNPQKLTDIAYHFTGLTKMDCYFKEPVKNSELKYYQNKEDLKNRILNFIVNKKDEGIGLKNISVLCFDSCLQDEIISCKPELFYSITEESLFWEDKILVSTAHSFKGLENQFILFVGPENYKSANINQKKVIFNAFMRAQYQFVYFMHDNYRIVVDSEFANNVIS